MKSQGLCDTTMTERFEVANCYCDTYEENLGPCAEFEIAGNGHCVYCDHNLLCHEKVKKELRMNEISSRLSAQSRKRTILDRLFPSRSVKLPEAPVHFKDVLYVNSTWTLDWKDRIRVFLSGRVETRVVVVCENEPGTTIAKSEYWAANPFDK